MVSFLKKNISTYSRIPQFLIIFHRRCRNIDIHAADSSVLMLNGIYCLYTLQNILYGIHRRMLSGFKGKALMSHVLKGDHLLTDFLLGQFTACYRLVFRMIGTINTAIHTVVG